MGNDITLIKNKNALKSILGRLIFPKGGKNMENLELQTTFNTDTIEVLVEDGVVENLEEVADNGNENE
jgi:hypothetical protein